MTTSHTVDELAGFTVAATNADLSPTAVTALKRNVLDTVACAIGALDGQIIDSVRAHAHQFSGSPTASAVGGGRLSVDQAAFFNTVLVRYPDLLDTYRTDGGLCHPADNFGTVLAVAEHLDATGSDFLLALAVAYEIQCRFSDQVPLMARGLNHALQLAMSTSAASAKLLGLDAATTADAIATSTVDNISLAAVHAEPVSHWKGISPAITGMRSVYTTMLAATGITGPKAMFDGPHGLVQLLDQPIDFHVSDRTLDSVHRTYLKQYCSLIHGQAVIDATLALAAEHHVNAQQVDRVSVEVFQGAYDFAGGGAYGDKTRATTKEQADYNLKYLTAVALLDQAVGPAQIETERVNRSDVQSLMAQVTIIAADDLTAAYPERTAVRIHITTVDGQQFSREHDDFEGSPTHPMSWDRVVDKFRWLAEPFCDLELQNDIIAAVWKLDETPVSALTNLLAGVSQQPRHPRTRHRL